MLEQVIEMIAALVFLVTLDYVVQEGLNAGK